MKNVAFVLSFLTLVPVSAFAPPQQDEITKDQLVKAMRFVNTAETGYFSENRRFASAHELLTWLESNGKLSRAPSSFSKILGAYEFRIAATSDVKEHYQASMYLGADIHNRSASCRPAAFSDELGDIYIGTLIGCEDTVKT